jgi:hypothetical protein
LPEREEGCLEDVASDEEDKGMCGLGNVAATTNIVALSYDWVRVDRGGRIIFGFSLDAFKSSPPLSAFAASYQTKF